MLLRLPVLLRLLRRPNLLCRLRLLSRRRSP